MTKQNSGFLNHHIYPLVVGNRDKYTFADWQQCGGRIQLKAGEAAVWRSLDEHVAVVDDAGLVRAVRTGITDIVAALTDGREDRCRILVIDNITRTTCAWVQLNTDHLQMKPGQQAKLECIVWPKDTLGNGAMNRSVRYTSEDESIVQVDSDGCVTALKKGETRIIVQTEDVQREDTCTVTVSEAQSETRVVRRTSDPHVADVNDQGEIEYFGPGEAEITATTADGSIQRKTVVVPEQLPACRRIFLNHDLLHAGVGQTIRLYALAEPSCVQLTDVTWHAEPDGALQIRKVHRNVFGAEEAVVEVLTEGEACVHATWHDFTAACRVIGHAVQPEWGIKPESAMQIDEVRQLQIQGQPLGLLHWLTEDRSALSISDDGMVKAYSAGTYRVFCMDESGLSTEEKEQFLLLKNSRQLSPEQCARLASLRCCRQMELSVAEGSAYLRNLHVPEETVTPDSMLLLWNRSSLPDTPQLDTYRICWTSDDAREQYAFTTKLGFRLKKLPPDTLIHARVEALDANNRILASCTLLQRTRVQGPVLDVTQPPFSARGDGRVLDTTHASRRAFQPLRTLVDSVRQRVDEDNSQDEVALLSRYHNHLADRIQQLNLDAQKSIIVKGFLLGDKEKNLQGMLLNNKVVSNNEGYYVVMAYFRKTVAEPQNLQEYDLLKQMIGGIYTSALETLGNCTYFEIGMRRMLFVLSEHPGQTVAPETILPVLELACRTAEEQASCRVITLLSDRSENGIQPCADVFLDLDSRLHTRMILEEAQNHAIGQQETLDDSVAELQRAMAVAVRSQQQSSYRAALNRILDAYLSQPYDVFVTGMVSCAKQVVRIRAEMDPNYVLQDDYRELLRCEVLKLESRKDLLLWFDTLYENAAIQIQKIHSTQKNEQMEKAVDYIRNHYDDCSLNVNALAERLNMSASHFSKIFRSFTGMSALEMITRTRMEKAHDMLLGSPGKDIGKIAAEVGYSSNAYFATAFKKYYGVSPSQFRDYHIVSRTDMAQE